MPAEIAAVTRRSSEAAMASTNSASPAAAEPTAKGREERSRSSVRWVRIRTVGEMRLARPKGHSTKRTMVSRPASAATMSGTGCGSVASAMGRVSA